MSPIKLWRHSLVLFAWFWVAALIVLTGRSSGRLVNPLSYSELLERSVLVVIAQATGTNDANASVRLELPEIMKDSYTPIVTTFRVKAVLKGATHAKEIEFVHSRRRDDAGLIVNGSRLAVFQAEKKDLRMGNTVHLTRPPDYLLFLKKRMDGRYTPVSGQRDPEFDVRVVFPGMDYYAGN